MRARSRTTRLRAAQTLMGVLVLVALVLAACSAAGPAAEPRPASGDGDVAVEPGAPSRVDGRDQADSADEPFGGQGSPIDRSIVKTGEITVEVPNVASALGQVRAMAVDLGGYVGGSQAGTLDERATLTLRIPSHRFDDALDRLHQLDGQVLAEATREEDVTGAIVDLEARIQNLQASEAQYRLLLERAEKIDDILNVQTRLDQVRGQIEQLQAQLKQLSGQADLATLTVSVVPQPQPVQATAAGWDPGATLKEALGALLAVGQGLVTALIWFGVVWLPILLVLAIIAMLVLRGLIEVRRRAPLGGKATPSTEPPSA
jgi:hypothetical protein